MTNPYRIKPGIIEINSVTVVRNDEDCIILLLDSKQKRPEIGAYGSTGGWSHVLISANEGTLHVDNPDADDTVVKIRTRGRQRWHMVADCGRYTITIVAAREKKTNG